MLQAGLIECGATALFLFFTIGTITSGRSQAGKTLTTRCGGEAPCSRLSVAEVLHTLF